MTEDITVCEGEDVPDLSATGEDIQWYTDPGLTTLVYSGNSFSPGQTQAGAYSYYVTQTELNCESPADSVSLQLHALPYVELGKDTIIHIDQDITLDIGIPGYSYLWSDGSDLSSCPISGSDIGLGDHTYWVAVTDANTCTDSDTIVIKVIDTTSSGIVKASHSITIFPVPTFDIVTIETGIAVHQNVEITSLNGRLLLQTSIKGPSQQIDLSSFEKGVYFITIRSEDFVTTRKIIKL